MKCQDFQYQRTSCVLRRIIKAWQSREREREERRYINVSVGIIYKHCKNERLLMATAYHNTKLKVCNVHVFVNGYIVSLL